MLFSIFLCLNNLYGQQESALRVKQLDYRDGLMGRRATAAIQDSDGFMWIATVDALNRYDGRDFKYFNQSNSKLNYRELSTRGLYEDTEGYLWLKYFDGVEFIHHRTFQTLTFEERFREVNFEPHDIKFITQGVNGEILIHLKNDEKYLYKNEKIQLLPFIKGNWYQFYQNGIGTYSFNKKELTLYDFEGNQKDVKSPIAPPFHISPTDFTYANQYNKVNHAFDILTCQNGDCEIIAQLPLEIEDIHYGRWRFKYHSRNNLLLAYNDLETNRDIYFIDIQTRKPYPSNLLGDKTFLVQDRNGVIWVGYKDGVVLIEFQKRPFDYYKDVINARGIWANEEQVVIASSHLKDLIYNINDSLPTDFYVPHGIYDIANEETQFWGGSHGQFSHVDINKQEILQTIYLEKSTHDNIWACVRDRDENWWFGSGTLDKACQLFFYNSSKGDTAIIFDHYNGFEHLKGAFITHLLEDENMIWASSNKGLICIDKQTGVIGVYSKNTPEGYQLPFQDIYWLYKDADNVYWAATNQNGLVRFTLNQSMHVQSYKQFTTEQHLSSNVIYTIFEDDFEQLWMSTLNGITCFDKQTEEVRVFSDIYGALPLNEFNRISGFQAIDGRIYFGGTYGAVGFHPNKFDTAQYNKPLILSSVQFFSGENEAISNQTSATLSEQKIVLPPSIRYAKIKIALADYFDAQDNRYFYKIEGLQDDFRLIDGNEVLLSGLPYGSYKIHFRGQSRDKQFSTSEISLPLIVVQPFYLRWWFILLVLATITAILRQLYNWRVAQLKKRQLELEKIVAQRTEEIRKDKVLIEQQAEDLRALDKLKDRFFANISHELRTPLTLILGPLSSILKDHSQLSNKHFTYLKVIKRHTNYLMKRINEIMELNRIEANKGQINLQPARLYDFLKISIGNFESIAPQKQITFSFSYQMKKSTQVLIDKEKVEHILNNYLSNAFKYTSKNGQIKVVVKEVDNKIRVEVKDSGVGIPKEDIPNLFQRFFQAENAQKAGSSGIGLALCREIAELLNGRVWVESEAGKGSSFYFEMPYEEYIGIIQNESTISQEEEEASEALNKEPWLLANKNLTSDKLTILLTEDNLELREYIQAMLSEFYNIYTAENGKEALKWLENNPEPSLIISDLMMPVMNGLELLEKIKKSDAYRHIPMLMLTARQSMEAKLSALQLGVDDYVTKPFNEQELQIRIGNLLNNQRERLHFIQEEERANEKPSNTKSDTTNQTVIVPPIQMSEAEQKWLIELEELVSSQLNNSQFTVTECAENFFLSERQLQRRIKKYTGLNFTKYLRLARLKKARQILEEGTTTSMSELAYQVGFETPAYFSKLFYKEYGKKVTSYFQR